MKFLVIADKEIEEEFKEKFESLGEVVFYEENEKLLFKDFDWIFDFGLHDNHSHISNYNDFKGILFISGQFVTPLHLKKRFPELSEIDIVGMNSLPSFINRGLLELCVSDNRSSERIKQELDSKALDYELVEDRVGLVTPRVVCMIINEAYYTVQEGTATKEAIDTAMKLGTNYPNGPFEWCEKIGIRNVFNVLKNVYEDTGDPRYMICPFLKKEFISLS